MPVWDMGKKTSLFSRHVDSGAKMVDFGGWDMPLHYGSQIDEHHAVRSRAGMFDVSHMTVVDIAGAASRTYLRRLLANDIDKLTSPGKGLYSCMLNESGGVVDDLIAYRRSRGSVAAQTAGEAPGPYRLVVNAATGERDLAWMKKVAGDSAVEITCREELVMLAVQGPAAREITAPLITDDLRDAALALQPFCSVENTDVFVARTGYTGEDGWELIMENQAGRKLWDDALAAGIVPCGLGARDTLRLEAGLNLYGQDMDAETSPLVSGLAWTVSFDDESRDFVGREALLEQRAKGLDEKLVGLVLEDRGIMRHGQKVNTEAGPGVVTSGGFSPTMKRSIALARVPFAADDQCYVQIRNSSCRATIVRPPFVRGGRILVGS